jgi:DNA-binding Lrp family transcriptional regulator
MKDSPRSPLSAADKKILRVLLEPNGKITSYQLASKTGLPRTTVQRRRRLLESRFLEFTYVLKLGELGFRRVDLLIATERGKTMTVSSQLLRLPPVVYVGRSVGEHTIDVRAEVIIKDNSELLDLLELVKGMEGVSDVVWSEIVSVVGKKKSIPNSVLDKL